MSDEASLREAKKRGDEAKRLLENPLLADAFAAIEKSILIAWAESDGAEHEARHNAYLMQRLLKNLKSQIERHVLRGDHAAKALFALQQANPRPRRRKVG